MRSHSWKKWQKIYEMRSRCMKNSNTGKECHINFWNLVWPAIKKGWKPMPQWGGKMGGWIVKWILRRIMWEREGWGERELNCQGLWGQTQQHEIFAKKWVAERKKFETAIINDGMALTLFQQIYGWKRVLSGTVMVVQGLLPIAACPPWPLFIMLLPYVFHFVSLLS